jgi:hypothetical protein
VSRFFEKVAVSRRRSWPPEPDAAEPFAVYFLYASCLLTPCATVIVLTP